MKIKMYVIKNIETGLYASGRTHWNLRWTDNKPRVFTGSNHAKNHIKKMSGFYKDAKLEIVEGFLEV